MKNSKFILSLSAAMLLAACGSGSSSAAASSAPAALEPASSEPTAGSESKADPVTPSSSDTTPDASSADSTPSTPEKDYFIDVPVTIDFWYNGNDSAKAWFESMAANFMEMEPNVTINYTKTSGSYADVSKLVNDGLAADNYPDMFIGYPDAVQYVLSAGKGVNLDSYISNEEYGLSEEDLDDFNEDYLNEGRNFSLPGTYCMPFAKSTEALFYNKSKLNGIVLAGVNGGAALTEDYFNNLTWEEFFGTFCPALTAYNNGLDDDKKLFTIADKGSAILSYDSDDNLFITLAQQYGYDYTDVDLESGTGKVLFNNEGMRNLCKTWNNYRQLNYACTTVSSGNVRGNALLKDRNALFYIGSTGGLTYAQDTQKAGYEVGIARVPYAAGHERKVINQGPACAFCRHNNSEGKRDTNRILASWLFYKYFTNPTNSLVWSINTGYSPVRWSAYETDEWAEYCNTEDVAAEYGVKSLEHLQALSANYVQTVANDFFSSPVFKGSAEARAQVGSLIGGIMNLKAEDCTDAKILDMFETAVNNTKAKM
ncbi:MAG: extracellular solute-binding protein [Bacilli bacterium]|nr:extracellular solute-binding protein [Bacilli bacterium]